MAKIRTRARTVDMLGRQQIAGIPTAVSELFKNAHDAYASHVEADFYRPERLLVLRDNGFGMTSNDVEERWLVLGTESKLTGDDQLEAVASSMHLEKRIPTGEKGIGRLSIAAIGPQVLLVTRARRQDEVHPAVAAFINWTLFALPGIALDEIEIPVREFADGDLPNQQDVRSMIDAVRQNLDQLRDRIDPNMAREIDAQLDSVDIDPTVLQRRFPNTSLVGRATGTQFFIQPSDPMVEVALDDVPGRRRVGDLRKMLIGFTNTMLPDQVRVPIVTEFRDHRSADFSESIIGPEAFFTPEEFASADHRFEGQFDEFGQFAGMVSVYGRDPEPHTIAWPEARGQRTTCGPFTIHCAYVQGAARDSRLEPEQWNRLITKLDSMGGLYIYRNGIRILPYGNMENDFLGIEERRNFGASYYFFSYRRMFGAIDLPSTSSDRLIEKAGREGFRDNRAYRQFRAILENFFIQLAADYFREGATSSSQFVETRSELNRQARAREQRERQTRVRRAQLVDTLADRGRRLTDDEPSRVIEKLLSDLDHDLIGASGVGDLDLRVRSILRAEETAKRRVTQIRDTFRVPQPRGFGLTISLRRDLDAYRAEFAKLDEQIFRPAFVLIGERVSGTVSSLGANVDRRHRFDSSATATQQAARTAVMDRRRSSQVVFDNTTRRVQAAIRESVADLDAALRDMSQRIQRTDVTNLSDTELVQLSLELDTQVEAVVVEKQDILDAISQQLEAIKVTPDDSGQIISQLDLVGTAEEELLALRERAEADLELTQLGMAIEIINHEFDATIRSVRNNLRRLRAWANVNDQLKDVYDGIRTNFDHLDSYLTLFTPLHRRLNRTETDIQGSEIYKFLQDLFRERMQRHDVQVVATRAFESYTVRGYPSTFYPVFVNLVDNAIFWLQDRPQPRVVHLGVDGDAMTVADNGPGIPTRDRESVFELGFTRKPGGRGLGLYISRDVLNGVGYDLTIADPTHARGTTFTIKPKVKDEN